MLPTERKVHRQLHSGSVWSSRHFIHPDDGLRYALRTETTHRAAYVEALRQRLGSTDPRQRTGAIALLDEFLPDIGADRALAALHATPLEPGQQPAWHIGAADLEQAAARALAVGATAADPHTVAWIKQLAVAQDYRVFLLTPLARLDPSWVLANTPLVSHQNLAVLAALPPDRQSALIDALAPWPPESPTVLTRAFWRRLPSAEAARLRSMIWPEPPSPTVVSVEPAFTYQIGSEFAPDARFGQETLSFMAAGDFTYTRRKQGQAWQRKGRAAPEVLASIEQGLAVAGFPVVPPHRIPPGASLITLIRASERAWLDHYKGQEFSGYDVIIERCEAWLRWLRIPSNPAAVPAGLQLTG